MSALTAERADELMALAEESHGAILNAMIERKIFLRFAELCYQEGQISAMDDDPPDDAGF